MDDSMPARVLAEVQADLERLWEDLVAAEGLGLETAEHRVREGVLAIGARLLGAGIAARGAGKMGARHPCPCGGEAVCAGYRTKQVQTVVGWITVRRAY